MTGASANELRLSCGISRAELARELGITDASVGDTFEAKRLRPATEERLLQAIGRINRRKEGERERRRTEAILAELPA
jgi:transcriptional regulator with XRE-family HTH domain